MLRSDEQTVLTRRLVWPHRNLISPATILSSAICRHRTSLYFSGTDVAPQLTDMNRYARDATVHQTVCIQLSGALLLAVISGLVHYLLVICGTVKQATLWRTFSCQRWPISKYDTAWRTSITMRSCYAAYSAFESTLNSSIVSYCIPPVRPTCGLDLAEIRELYGDSKFGRDIIPAGIIVKSNGHGEQKYYFNIFVSSDLDL